MTPKTALAATAGLMVFATAFTSARIIDAQESIGPPSVPTTSIATMLPTSAVTAIPATTATVTRSTSTTIPAAPPDPTSTTLSSEPSSTSGTSTPAPPLGGCDPTEVPVLTIVDDLYEWSGPVPDAGTAERLLGLAEVAGGRVVDATTRQAGTPPPTCVRVRMHTYGAFNEGSATVQPPVLPLLRLGTAWLSAEDDAVIVVTAHTDDTASAEYNAGLSAQRASAMVEWMVERGADPARVSAIGLGETEPIASNDDAGGRALNRRAELVVEFGSPVAAASGDDD